MGRSVKYYCPHCECHINRWQYYCHQKFLDKTTGIWKKETCQKEDITIANDTILEQDGKNAEMIRSIDSVAERAKEIAESTHQKRLDSEEAVIKLMDCCLDLDWIKTETEDVVQRKSKTYDFIISLIEKIEETSTKHDKSPSSMDHDSDEDEIFEQAGHGNPSDELNDAEELMDDEDFEQLQYDIYSSAKREAQECPRLRGPPSKVRDFITWILFFLCWWQAVNIISDSALDTLLKFLAQIFRLMGTTDRFIASVAFVFPASIYKLRNYLGVDKNSFERFVVCDYCLAIYPIASMLYMEGGKQRARKCTNHIMYRRKRKQCSNILFDVIAAKNGRKIYSPRKLYCYRPISDSIERILQKENNENRCNEWKEREVPEGYLADVYDGDVWKDFANPNTKNFLNRENTYGLMMNIDWFQPYKRRSNISVGVIYMSLMNLPREQRFKRDNVILVGILPSLCKEPKLATFLKPAIDELKSLWHPGVKMNTYNYPGGVIVRAALLCAASDIPAARKLCGYLGHSARLGCSRCMRAFKGGFAEKKDYSGFDRTSTEWPKRTHEENRGYIKKIQEAKTKGSMKQLESLYGLRYTPLYDLPYYDSVRFCVIDPMHNLYLGTAKHMWKIWTDRGIITRNQISSIDKRLEHMNVWGDSGWVPKCISSNWGAWTAQEWKGWILIYSMYCLHDILPKPHLLCWERFVKACCFISKPLIQSVEAKQADILFTNFGKSMENLYGKESITPNMHLHCHLIDCIRDYGSIYGFWLFAFERFNGMLGSINKNNKNIEVQIMRNFVNYDILLGLKHELPEEFSNDLGRFTEVGQVQSKDNVIQNKLIFPDAPIELNTRFWSVLDNMCFPSLYKYKCLDQDDISLLTLMYRVLYLGKHVSTCSTTAIEYDRLDYGCEHFSSYRNVRTRGNSLILAYWCGEDGDVDEYSLRPGRIRYFLKHSIYVDGEIKWHVLAVVQWFTSIPENLGYRPPLTAWNIAKHVVPGPTCFIPVQRILSRFAYVSFQEQKAILIAPIPRQTFL